MELGDLIGKTIVTAERMMMPSYDDEGWLRLEFTDGTSCIVVAGFCGYTGKSMDEYPTMIDVIDCCDDLVPIDACIGD